MRIALLQLNATIGAYAENAARLLVAYRDAVEQGAQLAIAPELFLCGYPPRDLLLRRDFVQRGLDCLAGVAAEIGPVPLLVGYVDWHRERPGRPLRNAAALLQEGQVIERVFKTLLPTYDVFDEDRYFEPAPRLAPLKIAGLRVGVTICEDIWNDADYFVDRRYRRDPVRELVEAGAELIVNLSASPWERGKERRRLAMLQQVVRDEHVPLVQVNLVGAHDELIFDGHSLALDAQGRVLAQAAGFVEETLLVDLATPTLPPAAEAGAARPAWPDPEEQLFRALVLGVRDYVQKCGFSRVVLGLSGGIDSALVAVIATAALGPERVWGVALPSKYSSPGSVADAAQLAQNLGIRFDRLPIADSVQAVETMRPPP